MSNGLSDEKWPQDLKPFKEKAEKMISNLKRTGTKVINKKATLWSMPEALAAMRGSGGHVKQLLRTAALQNKRQAFCNMIGSPKDIYSGHASRRYSNSVQISDGEADYLNSTLKVCLTLSYFITS